MTTATTTPDVSDALALALELGKERVALAFMKGGAGNLRALVAWAGEVGFDGAVTHLTERFGEDRAKKIAGRLRTLADQRGQAATTSGKSGLFRTLSRLIPAHTMSRVLLWQRPALAKSGPGTGEEAGATRLGTTQGGKDVTVSGADCRGYTDQDHHDAARLHAQAHVHHDSQAYAHRRHAEVSDDPARTEALYQEADRHAALAAHHRGRLEEHMAVASHAQARKSARETIGYRTFAMYPGGLTDADRQHYGTFTVARGES